MEYLWPDRRHRRLGVDSSSETHKVPESPDLQALSPPIRSSLDSPRALQHLHPESVARNSGLAPPGLRKLAASRSFTDLRSIREEQRRSQSIPSHSGPDEKPEPPDALGLAFSRVKVESSGVDEQRGDAALMMTRSSQKTFIFVKVARYVF